MTEICPACSQAYAYHTEIRCLDCDGPMCPICVQVTIRLEFSCTDCFECEDPNADTGKLVKKKSAQLKNIVEVDTEEADQREPGKVIDLVAMLKKSLAGKG